MLIVDIDSATPISGSEGTTIRQIFHPHNTMLGIRCSIAHCQLESGKKSTPHRLKSSEIYYIVRGEGTVHVDEERATVRSGQSVYIPPLSRQYIENLSGTTLEFLCIVDPAWRQEDEIMD